MLLSCKLCGLGRGQPEGLQTWNEFIKEHILICSIKSLDDFTVAHLALNAINMYHANLKVMNKQSVSEICTITASSDRWRVKNGTGVVTIHTPSFEELIDHLRDRWIPIP